MRKGRHANFIKAGVGALAVCAALLSPCADAAAQRRRAAWRTGPAPRQQQQQRVGADPRLVSLAQQHTGDQFRLETTTPRGVRVISVNPPAQAALRAIDDGLTGLFAAARRRGYRARLTHPEYTVFIARADRTRGGGGAYSPDIAVGAAQYAGSVYDQGGYIYAAGMVLSFQPCAFVVAEHERDFRRIADVARYEGEHLVLYHNDRRLYQQTADHSRGGSHPILQ